MIKLGKLIVLTQGEVQELADEARKQGYHAGNQAKNAAKKKPLRATEELLKAIAPDVVLPPRVYGDSLPLPNRNSATYAEGVEEASSFNMKESEMEDAA
jgi:hypothetical protein